MVLRRDRRTAHDHILGTVVLGANVPARAAAPVDGAGAPRPKKRKKAKAAPGPGVEVDAP